MGWARLDDTFHSHPKARRAGLAAVGLHALAISYCAQHLTDGHVDPEWVREKAAGQARRLAETLVSAGLWDANGDGWEIHDYLKFNPSREEILARREADLARKKRREP